MYVTVAPSRGLLVLQFDKITSREQKRTFLSSRRARVPGRAIRACVPGRAERARGPGGGVHARGQAKSARWLSVLQVKK